MKTCTLFVLLVVSWSVSCLAAETVVKPGIDEAHADLFEGAAVTSSSGIDTIATGPQGAFGVNVTGVIESYSVIASYGTTARIEFNPGMVSAGTFVISMASDGESINRTSSGIRLYADTSSGWEQVVEVPLNTPYHEYYGSYNIRAIVELDANITTDKWAIEWDPALGASGARLREIDAYPVVADEPEVIDIQTAVELSFPTVSGTVYRVQYSIDLTSTNWVDTAETLTGDGGTNSVFSSTGGSNRFYRVVVDKPWL